MSKDWVKDIHEMHEHYQVHQWVKNNPEKLYAMLKFRLSFLQEELNETYEAFENRDPEEVVDGLIDLCVVAIGTLDAYNIDSHKAWDAVYTANMAKEVGIKDGRPNPLGLPDLTKPSDWVGPEHTGNHGILPK